MNSRERCIRGLIALVAITLGLSFPAAAQVQIFSTGGGYGTPETISLVPGGFGAYGGSYFIPDAATSNIWIVPATGGPPTAFLAGPIGPGGESIIGGLFLPSGWGDDSGKFLVTAVTSPQQPAALLLYDKDGNRKSLDVVDPDRWFSTPLIAPANFISPGGQLFVTEQYSGVWRLDPSGGSLTPWVDLYNLVAFHGITAFGLEFTPSDWGAFGNLMLVSDGNITIDEGPGTRVSYIVAVSADGTPSIFTAVPLRDGYTDVGGQEVPGQIGLRQILMAPDNYFLGSLGISGRLLLVSVTGSLRGGGILGELLALNSSGEIVGHLQVGSAQAKFDPRGMLMTNDGHLLVSDSSDPILMASARDFVPGRGEALPPLAVKKDVLKQLTALRATITDKQDGKKLDDAIGHLTKSIDPGLWIDPSHPQPRSGATVFNEEKDAVTKLDGVAGDKHSTVPGATLQGFVNRLVQADEILARISINDGLAAKVDPKRIAQAKQELSNGNVQAAKGKPESAIEQYRNAWSHALKG